MVTTMQQKQQLRKAAALLLSEFRSRCYKLSCKLSYRNDFLPHIHNLLVLYLGTQLWWGVLTEGTEISAHLLACTRTDDYGMGAAPLAERN